MELHADSSNGSDARRQPLQMTAAALRRLRRSLEHDVGTVMDARRTQILKDALDAAVVVVPDGSVIIGVDVVIRDDRQLVTYALVPPGGGAPGATNLSTDSPLGRALLGHRSGDRVVVAAPIGRRVVEIVEVR